MQNPQIEKIWLPEPTNQNSHTSLTMVLLGVLGTMGISIALIFSLDALQISGVLERFAGRHASAVFMLLFFLIPFFSFYFLFLVLRKIARYGNVFIELSDKRLFYLNLRENTMRNHSGYSRIGALKAYHYMDIYLNQIRKTGQIPIPPAEILKVNRSKKTGPETFYLCWVLYPNEKAKVESIPVSEKLPEVDTLKLRLELLRNGSMPDINPSRKLLYAILCFVFMIVSILLCYLSHWDVGILTNRVYYPSMIATVVFFCLGGSFYLYHRRGY